jgi:hypothetical protein
MLKHTKTRRASLSLESLEERAVLSAASATLPLLHSNDGASKVLYLNFLGNEIQEDFDAGNGRNLKGLVTRAFDFDGDPTQFSGTEQTMIRNIWEIVAEDYAPFDIDVTTDYAGTFEDGVALNVAIGGTDRDAALTSGIAALPLGGFTNEAPNTVLVVSTNINLYKGRQAFRADFGRDATPTAQQLAAYMAGAWDDTIIAIGNTASHEAGHAFGLEHDVHLGAGTNYDAGTGTWTPIMGDNLSTDRHTWSKHERVIETGTEDGLFVESRTPLIDDLQILTKVLGLRADDHGDSNDLARPMTEVNPGLSFVHTGIIGTMDDKDVFSFQVRYAATYRIRVDVPEFGNLDSRFTLSTAAGIVGVINDHSGDRVIDEESGLRQIGDGVLGEEFEFRLEPGTEYFLQVDSNGNYGDLGQYQVSVTWVVPEIGPLPELEPIPYIPELDLVDPAPDVWSDPEMVDLPEIVDPLDYGPEDLQPSLDPSIAVSEDPSVQTWQGATSPVVEYSVIDATFSQLNYSVFKAASKYRFAF